MMKSLILGAGALIAVSALPQAAEAQTRRQLDLDRDGRVESWERRAYENRYDGGRYTERERRRDYRRGQRDQYRDGRYGPPYGHAYGHRSRWQRGAYIPREYRSGWYVRDYGRYGYGPPPRGHGYYRTDTGDIVLAVIATGLIVSLFD